MSLGADALYKLLPAIYQIRDAERGEPLRALLDILEQQGEIVEDDIRQLYKNWFIETCDEWAVPYIGALLGVRHLHRIGDGSTFSARAFVANTLGYRRRKGTATMLEQLANDATGWRARAVEFFELLQTSQHFNHVRFHSVRTPDLRKTDQLELLGTAFDTIQHTPDVRSVADGRCAPNIPDIGLFLWRLQSYEVVRSVARSVAEPPDGRYTFNPLGYSQPLFNRPRTEDRITQLAGEINVPTLLRRRLLYDELEGIRNGSLSVDDALSFGADPVVSIYLDDPATPIDSDQIMICDLSDPDPTIPEGWKRPPSTSGGKTIRAGIDPVLGRLALPTGDAADNVWVGYSYGFSGDVGGGPYDRQESVEAALTRSVDWQVGVARDPSPVGGETIFSTVSDAVDAWNSWSASSPGKVGVIAVLDSSTYQEELTGSHSIAIPAGSLLLLVAAEWPATEVEDTPGAFERKTGSLEPNGPRPHIIGDLEVSGTALSAETKGEFALDGFLIEGQVTIKDGELAGVRIAHSTLVPDGGGLLTEAGTGNSDLVLTIYRSICGPVTVDAEITSVQIVESIIQKVSDDSVTGTGATTHVDVQGSTIIGLVRVSLLNAGNSIFTESVHVERRQEGCLRFCFVPFDSATPRRYRCQPDLALSKAGESGAEGVKARIVPAFTSTQYGDPAFGQLSLTCAEEIRTGAEDGSEMGAFGFLKQAQREANLRANLDEYLRLGLEAGIIYVT